MPESLEFVPIEFLPAKVDLESNDDGSLVARSPASLPSYPPCLGEYLERWARDKPDDTFLAERDGEQWRTQTWAEARNQVRAIAANLLRRGLSADRPVAVLSDNSIEHGLVALAAMHIGVPVAPISPAYSLMSKDFGKLRTVFDLLRPGLVFVNDATRFARAIEALGEREFDLVVSGNSEGVRRPSMPFEVLLDNADQGALDAAFAAVNGETIAKFLLTSGSTGEPKAVINTQRMLCSNQAMLAACWPFVTEEPPVLVDWLPWNHTFGGNHNFNLVLAQGGQLYIDEGKPAPGLIEKTVRNLSEISPTIYFNAPRGYDVLLPYLESDAALRRSFFERLKLILYAAAALPESLWERLDRLSIAQLGKRVRLTSSWGSTETAPLVTSAHFEPVSPSVIGLPAPGCEVKMIPAGDGEKYELRVWGPNVTPGYWRRDDLTEAAFDDEGFYRIGDAGRFADPDDPSKGLEFAGRLAEEFKLTSGTWVHVDALRVRAISSFSPLAQDIVIAGHDRDEISFLIFPNLSGCRGLCAELGKEASLTALLADERIRGRIRDGMESLRVEGAGSSTYATRALFLEEPPSIDAGEITDKGYINQRAVLERRLNLVERLYADPAPEDVILLSV